MANKQDMDFTYTTIDKIFRLSMGETGDYSGAMYNGNYSLSLEKAQEKKHAFIAESLGIKAGSKVLDMACGWGPFLRYIKKIGAEGIGVTLSSGQAEACKQNGLDVKVMDCRTVKPGTFGTFDAVTCIGGLEHFCSIEEYKAGKQSKIYADFFKTVYDLLPAKGRFYMQTMVFSKNMLPLEEVSIKDDRNSASYVIGLIIKEFPGSWLPYGDRQVIDNAAPYFKLISKSSGRLDYIQTINEWRKRFRKFNLKKYLLYASLIPKFITNKEFRHLISIFRVSPNKVCFEKEIFDHYRLVFEKI